MKYLLLLALLPLNALALDLSIVHLSASEHHNTDFEYNERHDGTGVELSKDGHRFGLIPKYTNSYGDPSTMVTYGYTFDSGFGGTLACAAGYKDNSKNIIRCIPTVDYTFLVEVTSKVEAGIRINHLPAIGKYEGITTFSYVIKFDGERK